MLFRDWQMNHYNIPPQHSIFWKQDYNSAPMITRYMVWCMNTQFSSWEACFNKKIKRKTWYSSKACRANLLTEGLEDPKLHSLLQNDNQENLEWISRREAGCFKLTAAPVNYFESKFRSQFSFIVRIWKQLLLESNQDDSTVQIHA